MLQLTYIESYLFVVFAGAILAYAAQDYPGLSLLPRTSRSHYIQGLKFSVLLSLATSHVPWRAPTQAKMTKPLCRSKTIFKLLVGQSLTIPADVLHY